MPVATKPWDAWFQEYLQFLEVERRPPSVSATGAEYDLARWFNNQRIHLARSTSAQSEERRRRLSAAVPHWDNKLRSRGPWEERLEAYVDYRRQHGHDPTETDADAQVAVIGRWIRWQRKNDQRGVLLAERRAQLDAALPDWRHPGRRRSGWQAKFDELAAFRAEHGRDPRRGEQAKVAQWLSTCRGEASRGTLSAERTAQLDALNPNWRTPDSWPA